jgi:hypothetical protein
LFSNLGITLNADIPTALPVYNWDPLHPVWNSLESVPDFTTVTDTYIDDGDRVFAASGAVGGFTTSPMAGEAAVIVAPAGNVIVNSFLVVENLEDLDSDGTPDAAELFINEINLLLGGIGDCTWLTENPISGVIPAGGSQPVDIMVDATGLTVGVYTCDIVISSNDPDENPVVVPVTLNVVDVDMVTVTWCEPPPITGISSQPDTVYICVDDVTGKNIIAYQLTVGFDNAVLNCVDAISVGTISAPFGPPTVNCATPGEITVGGFGTSPLAGSGALVGLIFNVVGAPGDITDLCINNMLFNAGDPAANIPNPCCPYEVLNIFDITGNVIYCPNGNPVPNADMILTGGASATDVTDPLGYYEFLNLLGGQDYTVTPSKSGDVDPLFDISCFDAALCAQIAVGILSADHCDSLAADVDEDGNIFTFDAALICRYAVGLPPFSADDHTGEWRFEPASRSYTPLNSDQPNQDYSAALLGDVDGNWTPAAPQLAKQGIKEVSFEGLNGIDIPAGEIISIPFMVEAGEEVISADIDFRYDPQIMRFVEVATGSLAENFQVIANTEEDGRVRVGAFSATAVTGKDELLALRFEVIGKDRQSGNMTLDRYLVNGSLLKKGERSFTVGASKVPTRFALHQNYPNPFNPETVIRFDIPQVRGKQVRVRISIYNTAGQLVRVLMNEQRKPGIHEVTWDGRDGFGNSVSSGVYFYIISAGDFFSTKKMVLLK